ncbi:outer membrane beta-barrel protein [Pseudopedobacter beijingensis]|uniref:Outer membrane beta-barrel protein n=1 Tax=Pseudopedobacter beijingensis TaxID=1207056 RepID=A0ABW4I947_9SPHI
MLKKIVFLGCILSAAGSTYAQSVKINGKLQDTNHQAIEYAGVSILRLPDSVRVKGTLTDSLGNFSFSGIAKGKYFIKANFMGYKPYTGKPFNYDGNTTNMGALIMESQASQMLSTVTVVAQKPLIEQQIDKTVLNVENSILSEGNTALELLEKAPGVNVDHDGNVSLKGRSGTSVLINGKLTYLSGRELSNLLKGTNSSSISKIEVMSNPSSKYDAAGNGGIINIVMKKNTATGFNGSVTLNGGSSRKARYDSGATLNFRSEKLNAYGNYTYGYRGETEYLDFSRNFYDNGIASGKPDRTSFQDTKTDEPLHTHNFRAGVDYFLNDKNTLGFLINGNSGKYTHDSKTGNLLLDNTATTVISDALSHNYDKQSWESLTYNLNFVHKFNKEGYEIAADADYSSNSFTSLLNLDTKYKGVTGDYNDRPSFRKGYIPSTTDVYVGKIDYSQPFLKNGKLELGIKSSFVEADNNLSYDTLKNNQWVNDAGSSNYFRYNEQIHAGYLSVNKDLNSFSIQLGLRGEYTQTKGHQITSDSLVNRNYFQLFPSLFLTKAVNKDDKVQFAYSRRIERPGYGDLNPFRVFRDPFLFYQGNPFLKPELTHTLQLSHSIKGKYITAINYNYTKDVMNWVPGQIDSINTTFSTPLNLSSFVNYGISFTASTNITRWWSGSHFANLYRNEYKGNHQQGTLNNSMTSFSFNSQNTLRLGNGFSAEVSGLYHSKVVYGISSQKPFFVISSGIQKSLLNDMAVIKLMVNDIFQSKQLKRTTQYENIDMYTHINLDNRRAMLSFTYRFGNQNIKKRERTTGSEDVTERVKGG